MEKSPELGFGIMRMPQKDNEIDWEKSKMLIDEYMKGDFCYFDTHPWYMMNQSQKIIKKFVAARYDRRHFFLANKMPYCGIDSYEDYDRIFEQELKECGVKYFDYYLLHAVSEKIFEMHEKLGGFQFLIKMRAKGKVKKIGISFHDKAQLLEEILKKYPEIDFVQLQINYVDWESPVIQAKACYETACKYRKEIIVMEPIKGGSLILGEDSKAYARHALQFVKSLPGIKVILSGMSEIGHIRENRSTLSAGSGNEEIDFKIYQNLRKQIKEYNTIPCTECRYCMRECRKKVKIPEIFSLMNAYYRPGTHDKTIYGRIKMIYQNMVLDGGAAGECVDCGMCEKRCPQKISIRKDLRKAVDLFEKKCFYTSERNAQILIYLMREYGIKKVIVSPGATNAPFVYSVQQDDFFEIYSAPDERSAAYMACGLAVESGEVVALSCTGATASRNYVPGLTEAYYRNIPILAITSGQPNSRIGHNIPQMLDRTRIQKDIAKVSVEMPIVKDGEDEWNCVVNANKAINELWHRGTGPVHINLFTTYCYDFSTRKLPYTPVIRRIQANEQYPDIFHKTVGIFCGSHRKWEGRLTKTVDTFCERYGSAVICDHTSNYPGEYRYTPTFYKKQSRIHSLRDIDLLIHIGDISGAGFQIHAKEVWRVHPNGEYCDTFRNLSYVFEMEEMQFFQRYCLVSEKGEAPAAESGWPAEENAYLECEDMPFSNAWIASQTSHRLPDDSVLHLGILNSLRVWNYSHLPKSIRVYSNVGGFGIDGCLSTLIGASLANPEKLYFGVVGDLAFFYDMNALGNRHIGNNIRLLVVNNGCGTEFKNYNHDASILGNQTGLYIAAEGHYGNKSERLLKDYAEDLGFIYRAAWTKEDYINILPEFVNPRKMEKSLVIEAFTDSGQESDALRVLVGGEDGKGAGAEKAEVIMPEWLKGLPEKEIVLWGCGYSFTKNISKIEQYCTVRYVCDNNQEKWGKEVSSGVMCISPNELKNKKDIFVVIVVEDIKVGFRIGQQLHMMGIHYFDVVENWMKYAKNMKWRYLDE